MSLDIPDTEDVVVTNSRLEQASAVVYHKYVNVGAEQAIPAQESAPCVEVREQVVESKSVDEVLSRENITGEKMVGGEVGGEEEGCKGEEGEVEGREEEKPDHIYDLNHTIDTALDLFQFPCQSGIYTPQMELTRDFVLAFGEDHVTKEFLKARSWLLVNPEKRKTQRGMGRFLNAWLCREAGMKRIAVKDIKSQKTDSLLSNGTENTQGW